MRHPDLPFPRVTICESPPQEPRTHNDRHESTLEEEGSRGAKSVERKLGRDARGFGRVFEGRSARQCARSSLGKGVPRSLGVQRKTTGRVTAAMAADEGDWECPHWCVSSSSRDVSPFRCPYSSRDTVARATRGGSVHATSPCFLAFRFSQGFLVTGDHDPETTTEDRAHRDQTEHRPDRYSPRIISQPTQHAIQLGGEQDMRGVREPARVRRRRSRCVTAGCRGGGAAREHVVLRRLHLPQRHVLVALRHLHAGESASANPGPTAARTPSRRRRRAVFSPTHATSKQIVCTPPARTDN